MPKYVDDNEAEEMEELNRVYRDAGWAQNCLKQLLATRAAVIAKIEERIIETCKEECSPYSIDSCWKTPCEVVAGLVYCLNLLRNPNEVLE